MMANTWQGQLPWENLLEDGHLGTSPIKSFPPNGYGLWDMTGNVWEWTVDYYAPQHEATHACCGPASNPRVTTPDASFNVGQPGGQFPRRVVKGGSHLCAPSYCLRYRPAARQPQTIETSMAHMGTSGSAASSVEGGTARTAARSRGDPVARSGRSAGTSERGCAATSSPGLTVWAVLVPGGARLRHDRRRLARGRASTPRPAALILYAAFGSSRHLVDRADGGDRRALGRRRRRHRRPAASDDVPALTVTLALVVGRHRAGRRAAAPRLPGELHLRAGAQGLHHRPRAHDHGRAAAQAVRRREERGRLLREARGTC